MLLFFEKAQKKRENGEGIRFLAVNVVYAFTEKEGDGLAICL